MGEGDERPGCGKTRPLWVFHNLPSDGSSSRPRDEDRDGDRGDRGGVFLQLVNTGHDEFCEMETACFECETDIFL